MALIQGKSILLIIGGGIAAYKGLDLIRRLKERGAKVRCVLTQAGQEFVTPLAVSVLSEEPAFTDLFDLKNETEIGHIRLSREADLIIVAPATADLLAKMAHGFAGDLATAVLLAGDKPVLAAPAMNWRMWGNAATRRNFDQLKADGIQFIGPEDGAMACGEWGTGRMAEPDAILATAAAMLGLRPGPLRGRHVLITAGPTFEPIDPVRFLGNRSSGKQGYAIATQAARLGARVTLVSGPAALPVPDAVAIIRVETAKNMLEAVEAALPADIAIFNAAVADWRPVAVRTEKIKKGNSAPQLRLAENPDILKTVARRTALRPSLVIGFAAETENVIDHAKAKLESKGCDWIAANDVSAGSSVFGGGRNKLHLITRSGVQSWPEMTKEAVAERLMLEAASYITRKEADASPVGRTVQPA
jgi:phosphopantothenoylcysteine decarboxylase / phosphopantothenate---cysteine ligase